MAIEKPNIIAKMVGELLQPTQIYFRIISALIDFANSSPVTKDFAGSPEGNVTAKFKDQCWDTVNNKLYFKSTATGDTGWVILN